MNASPRLPPPAQSLRPSAWAMTPQSVRVDPATGHIYVANQGDDTVSVIDGASNPVIATVPVGDKTFAIGVNSVTSRIYVTNRADATVSVIDGASNAVIDATVTLTITPQ